MMNMKWDLFTDLQSGAIISINRTQALIGYGKANWIDSQSIQPHLPAFYFPDFFLTTPHPWVQFEHWQIVSIDQLIQALRTDENDSLHIHWEDPKIDAFQIAFKQLFEYFDHTHLQKAVPYVFTHSSSSMQAKQLNTSMKRALSYLQNHHGSIYGYWQGSKGLLGVTPECLFDYDQQNYLLNTVALAGTCPKSTSFETFKSSDKEKEEHALVIEGIKQALQSFGTVSVGATEILELPVLNHLITPIQLRLQCEASFEELVKALHPTPALGTYPKKQGEEWLLSYQHQVERGHYGAPVGIFYPEVGISQCLVGIRNVQWNTQGMRIGAGCGVTKDSQCEKEWKEINLKIKAIRECLNL